MSTPLSGFLATLIDRIQLHALLGSLARAVVMVGVFYLVISVLEARSGADRARYASKNFRDDLLYTLFYQGGFYSLFIGTALANALHPRLDFLKLDLLSRLPEPLNWVAFWISADFLGYWFHRFEHAWRPLWALHSLHHSQEQLTFVTSWRNHPVEQIIANLIMFTPLLVLGIPTHSWLPLVMAQYALEAVQHSTLPWRYGPLYGVVVSPVFHQYHHSADPRHHHRNFGKILSIWDRMFGTAVPDTAPARRFGIEGVEPPASFREQMLLPLRIYRPARESRPAGTPALDISAPER